MIQACRDRLHDSALLQKGAHAGLLLSSYLQEQEDNDARKAILESAQSACYQAHSVYTTAFQRWKEYIGKGAVGAVVEVDGRMVIGLGAESPLETGLTLHHTFGTPILPGSALKGLASHYCAQVWGRQSGYEGFSLGGPHYLTLFGAQEDSGHIIFADAWCTPDSLPGCLQRDVMAVHHPDYYRGLQSPTDYDDPTPISFLSIKGRFQLFVRCDVPSVEGERWAKLALDLTLEALANYGLGGKTNAGYGRLRLADSGSVSHSAPSATRAEVTSRNHVETKFQLPCIPGASVPAILLVEKTKKGGWMAEYRVNDRSWIGPIQNSNAVPADLNPGDQLKLVVAFIKMNEIAFRYVP